MRIGPSIAVALLLASGCSDALSAYAPTESETDPELSGPVGIDELDPRWGPTDGGTTVQITGWGFAGDVEVLFGAANLDVTVVDDETLVVSSPSARAEVPVDVTVRSDLGSATRTDGFTYSDSGAPPETDTEDSEETDEPVDTEVTATGLSGGVVEMGLAQYACPDCLGVTEELDIFATALLHEGASGSYTDWIPAAGSCASDPVKSFPSATSYDVGSWVYLESGSRSIGMARTSSDGDTLYEASGLGNDDFARTSSFDLTIPDGGDLGGPVDIEDAVYTPQGFSSITPIEILYTSTSSAFSARFSRTSATQMTWSPTGDGLVVVDLLVYNAAGNTFLGEVICAADDDGSTSIPSGYLSSYPQGALMIVYVYRLELGDFVNPADGNTVESLASIGVVGTGVVR